MTQLDCTVTNCSYNKDCLCSKACRKPSPRSPDALRSTVWTGSPPSRDIPAIWPAPVLTRSTPLSTGIDACGWVRRRWSRRKTRQTCGAFPVGALSGVTLRTFAGFRRDQRRAISLRRPLFPGGLDLCEVVLRPLLQGLDHLQQRPAQLGQLVAHRDRNRRDDAAAHQGVGLQAP